VAPVTTTGFAARTDFLARRVKARKQAQVEHEHLANVQLTHLAARVGVEAHSAQATRRDLGKPAVVVHNKDARNTVARVLRRAEQRERLL